MAIETRTMLETDDPEIWSLLQRDHTRHNQTLNFIASENYASPAVLQALASHLNAKYAEGDPKGRYYQGVALADDIETLAIERAKQLFGAEHANVQPHSGSTANMAAYYAVLELGDGILASAQRAGAIGRAVVPMLEGGRSVGAVAARAVSFPAPMQPSMRPHCEQIVKNAPAVADEMGDQGLTLRPDGRDNRLLVLS